MPENEQNVFKNAKKRIIKAKSRMKRLIKSIDDEIEAKKKQKKMAKKYIEELEEIEKLPRCGGG